MPLKSSYIYSKRLTISTTSTYQPVIVRLRTVWDKRIIILGNCYKLKILAHLCLLFLMKRLK